MVDSSKIERNARKSEWASRYNDRDTNDSYANRPVEDGQIPDAPRPPPKNTSRTDSNGDALWNPEEEGYYGESSNRRSGNASNLSLDSNSRSSGRWHYPANFDDATEIEPPRKGSKSKSKSSGKDRWARSEEARMGVADEGSSRKKKRKSTSRTQTDDSSTYREAPEDPFAGNYGRESSRTTAAPPVRAEGVEDLNHEF